MATLEELEARIEALEERNRRTDEATREAMSRLRSDFNVDPERADPPEEC